MSHGACMKKSCCTFEWVMLYIPSSPVARMGTALRDMTRLYACHNSVVCVTWLIYICNMTHSWDWHESFTCVTWRICIRDMTLMCMCDRTHSYVRYDSFISRICFINICHMTYPCVHTYIHKCAHTGGVRRRWRHRHDDDAYTPCGYWHYVTRPYVWRMHMCDWPHSFVWRDPCISAMWRMHMRDMSHLWHDSFILVTWLICTYTGGIRSRRWCVHTVWLLALCALNELCYFGQFLVAMMPFQMWHGACMFVTWRKHSGRERERESQLEQERESARVRERERERGSERKRERERAHTRERERARKKFANVYQVYIRTLFFYSREYLAHLYRASPTATHYTTLWYTATLCNTLQHTATNICTEHLSLWILIKASFSK